MNSNRTEYLLLFHSAYDVPPPLAFRALINLQLESENACKVEFSMEYTGREDMPPEEIEAEGYSMDDDFHWKGDIPVFWYKDLVELSENCSWKEASDTQVLLAYGEGDNWLSPGSETELIRFSEELIQACLEQGGRELPMEMVFGELIKNNFFESIWLEWRFAQKEIYASAKGNIRAVFGGREWDDAEAQLKIWMEDEARGKDLYQLPKFKGNYWLVNNEIWLPDSKKISGRLWEWVKIHKPC